MKELGMIAKSAGFPSDFPDLAAVLRVLWSLVFTVLPSCVGCGLFGRGGAAGSPEPGG
jgi:hypothetical protein